MPTKARSLIKFWWILPALYIVAFLILMIGMISGGGHTPRSLDFLMYVLGWPSYLVDRVLPRFETKNPLLNFSLFLIVGLIGYGFLGLLVDIVIGKLKRRSSSDRL
jgi:hypothetical protein